MPTACASHQPHNRYMKTSSWPRGSAQARTRLAWASTSSKRGAPSTMKTLERNTIRPAAPRARKRARALSLVADDDVSAAAARRSEEHTSELQSLRHLV